MVRETFDYIVVGAGSAGAVVAARLTEDPGTTVLLLEAGGPAEADEITIPAAFPALFKTKWDWNYTTAEQKQLHQRRAYWPRMKALGGCSSMNAMIYIRGSPRRLRRVARRARRGRLGLRRRAAVLHPRGGQHPPGRAVPRPRRPAARRGPSLHAPLSDLWVESAVANGFKPNDDFNGAEQEGAGRYQVTQKKGRRWSVAKAYLEPAAGRDNLTVRTAALATRVVVEGGRAVGVAYLHGRDERTSYAGAEVVLSGGAINSPQLLMLSGIGPADHLREVGVDVVVEQPGRRREPARPPGGAADLAHQGHQRPGGVQQPRQLRPGEGHGLRAAGEQRGGVRRVLPLPRRPGRSRTSRCTWRRAGSGTTACTSRRPAR